MQSHRPSPRTIGWLQYRTVEGGGWRRLHEQTPAQGNLASRTLPVAVDREEGLSGKNAFRLLAAGSLPGGRLGVRRAPRRSAAAALDQPVSLRADYGAVAGTR